MSALAQEIRTTLSRRRPELRYRLLFSAHGLPQRTIATGDPYQWQVERTAQAIVADLPMNDLEWKVSYQSRIGPQKWLEPRTDSEIRVAGAEKQGVIVVPVAFVSEHSETLVELDMDYARLALDAGVPHYLRVPTVRTNPAFIEGLAELVLRAAASAEAVTCAGGRICPAQFTRCGMSAAVA